MNQRELKLVVAGFVAAAMVSVAGLVSVDASAATRTWTGAAGDNKFSTAGNWQENQAPAAGDSLLFGLDSRDTGTNGSDYTLDNDIGVGFSGLHVTTYDGDYRGYTEYCIANGIQLIDGASFGEHGSGMSQEASFSCGDNTYEINLLGSATKNGHVRGVALTVPEGHILELVQGSLSLRSGTDIAGELVLNDGMVTAADGVDIAHARIGQDAWMYILPQYNGSLDMVTANGGHLVFGSPYGGIVGGQSDRKMSFDTRLVLTADLGVKVQGGLHVTLSGDIEKNGYKLAFDSTSDGRLTIGKQEQVNPASKVTYSGNLPSAYEIVVRNQIATLDGVRQSITVNDGGILMGSGTITDWLSVSSGGVLAPGNSPGEITTRGMTLSPGSIYRVDVQSKESHDKIIIAEAEWQSTTSIEGAILELSFLEGYAINKGDEFVIIDDQRQDAFIEGTFKDLPEGAKIAVDGVVFSITYRGGDGNDVSLIALNDQSAPVLSAPNTGSKLVTANPVVIAMAGVVAAAAILFVAKRRTSN